MWDFFVFAPLKKKNLLRPFVFEALMENTDRTFSCDKSHACSNSMIVQDIYQLYFLVKLDLSFPTLQIKVVTKFIEEEPK